MVNSKEVVKVGVIRLLDYSKFRHCASINFVLNLAVVGLSQDYL